MAGEVVGPAGMSCAFVAPQYYWVRLWFVVGSTESGCFA
jgi:hypothetical protein